MQDVDLYGTLVTKLGQERLLERRLIDSHPYSDYPSHDNLYFLGIQRHLRITLSVLPIVCISDMKEVQFS